SMASRNASMAMSASSSAMASRRLRMASRSAAIERPGDDVDRMANVEPRSGEVHDAPWVGAGDDGSPGRGDGCDLSGPDLLGHRWVDTGVGSARSATQAVVAQLDQVGVGGEHGSHVLMGLLDVAEVTRVLDRDRAGEPPPGGRQPAGAGGQPLVYVEHPVG